LTPHQSPAVTASPQGEAACGAKKFTLIHLANENECSYNGGTKKKTCPRHRKRNAMSEEAIEIAVEYMRGIAPMFQASVLKILYAYAEKSK